MVGIGILLNKNDIHRLSGEIAALRSELRADISRVDARTDALSKQLHDAILMLVDTSNALDKQVSRLEDKS